MGGLLHVTGDPAGPPTKVEGNWNSSDFTNLLTGWRGNDRSYNCIIRSWSHSCRTAPKERHRDGPVDPVQPVGHTGERIQVETR